VARWTLCWLALIASLTVVTYVGTNTLVAQHGFERTAYAMLPLAELGSTACSRATRNLVAAGDGSAAGASAEQRDAYELAAAAVLAACGTA
jgi:hypothetical protein